MRISTQTRVLYLNFGLERAVQMEADAGFDCVDLSMTPMAKDPEHPLLRPDYKDTAVRLLEIARAGGVTFNQAHAPFQMKMRDYFSSEEDKQHILFLLCRSIEVAGLVGAGTIVVHPVQHENYLNHDPKFFLEINKAFYG